MMLDFRQRLLTTTLLVGASVIATPAFAQGSATPPECPAGTVPGEGGACNPADTAQGTGTQPETTTPVEGSTAVPSTSASGEPVRSSQDIVITGSRIPQPNLTSASPVTVLSSQEVKLQGTSRTEDLVNSLPQSFAAQGSNISNGASGTATVNLRGLGSNRSLVLVNGRRLHPGDTGNPVPDLNFIPTQLIKRVDVLTGGASSVYGADAVGGVVNFIMDNTFTGVRLDAQASLFMHNNDGNEGVLEANEARGFRPPTGMVFDGGAGDLAAVIGAAFDDGRGHVQAYATYRRQRSVLQSGRDYSFCALAGVNEITADQLGRNFTCGGSGTSAAGTFYAGSGARHVEGDQFVPGRVLFNFAPYNFFQRPDERYTFGAFADYEISSGFKPYLEAMFMDDRSLSQIAPSGNFFNTNTINCDNALMSPEQLAFVCRPANIVGSFTDPVTGNEVDVAALYIGRRNVEGGGRQDDLQHTAYRIVAGMRGDAFKGVSYDAYYQYGRTLRQQTYKNDFSVTRLQRALDVIDNPDTPEFDPVCRSVLTGEDTACVPWNIFRTGGVTAESTNYLQVPANLRGKVDEAIAHADFTINGADYGLQTPWAENGLGFNIGAEYRKQSLEVQPDENFQLGNLAGQGGPTLPVAGKFDVREWFAEAQIPLVEDNFIDLLQISAGYRYSNYKTEGIDPFSQVVAKNSFNTNVYKIAGEFAPIPDVRFRVAYNRAVRAPNIIELYSPTGLALTGTNDPCAGDFDPDTSIDQPDFTAAQCLLTGVSAAQYGNVRPNAANQYNGILGGSAFLEPEKADTLTAGVIIQPRFIPGLAVTVDYFDIKIDNLIGAPGFESIINQCVGNNVPQDLTACDLIFRNANGGLTGSGANAGFILQTNQNFPGRGLFTKGWDLSGSYSRRMGGLGTLNASFIGTLVTKLGTPTDSGVGRFAATTPSPKWRHKMRVGFQFPNGIGISGQWRYFSRVFCDRELDLGCTQTVNIGGVPTVVIRPGNSALNAKSFFDLALTARVTNKFNLRFGANNVLDTDPPVAGGEVIPAGFGNGNTYPQVYDSLGRYLFAGVTIDF